MLIEPPVCSWPGPKDCPLRANLPISGFTLNKLISSVVNSIPGLVRIERARLGSSFKPLSAAVATKSYIFVSMSSKGSLEGRCLASSEETNFCAAMPESSAWSTGRPSGN